MTCIRSFVLWAHLLSWVLLLGAGCSPGRGEEPSSDAASIAGPDKAVRWAEGFGWAAQGRLLWLADTGDTTWWAHQWSGPGPGSVAVTVLGPAVGLQVATWSTTHVPYLRAIGAEAQWVASGYAERVQLPEESIVALGGDAGLDEERLLVSGADLLTSYPFGNPMEGTSERTGVPVLPLTEYAESHPLGRAEYLRVFGWLTGREAAADSVFDVIESAYSDIRLQAEELAAAQGRPVVFTGSSQNGRWTAPGAEGLVARLIQDAGGRYAFEEAVVGDMALNRVGSNYEVELEQCAAIAARSAFWGKVVHAPEGWDRTQAQLEAPWCDFTGKTLFHCNTAEVDYFGAAVLEPHRMLADLAQLLHGLDSGAPRTYFKPTPP